MNNSLLTPEKMIAFAIAYCGADCWKHITGCDRLDYINAAIACTIQ